MLQNYENRKQWIIGFPKTEKTLCLDVTLLDWIRKRRNLPLS
jgi:ATP-dependent RNA circularization protein (DNA/RNA ligase family)